MSVKSLSIDKKTFFMKINEKSDQIFSYAILGYFLVGVFLAMFYDTWLIGLVAGGLCLLAYFGAKLVLPNHNLYQYVGAGVLAVFMAQFIYQMHGLFEMHFWAFVGATLLITYQNWKLFIPLSLLIVVHHALFAYLQFAGAEIYFTQLDYMDLQTFIFHALLAVVIIVICAYWSYDLSLKTIDNSLTNLKLEKQLKSIDKNIQFAEEISNGNLDISFEGDAEDNELGMALRNMQKNLLKASEREKQDRFVSDGISRLSDLLRNHMHDLQELSDQVLKEIVKYLELNQGAIFLVEEKENEELVLVAKSCYAYSRKKFMEKEIMIGEGLVGQAYLEKEYIYMTEIPQGYANITSGLGDASASSILVMPLKNNDDIIGILELASLKTIPKSHIDFLLKAAESIASTILSANINSKTKVLLEKAQEQAEALKSQEEEMRQNMEEMQATQEEMNRRTDEYESTLSQKEEKIKELEKKLGIQSN